MEAALNESLEFMHWWRPNGPWVLTAISPNSGQPTLTATFRDDADVIDWLKARVHTHNIYFHVNPTRYDLSSKAKRADIKALAWLHVDIDPRPIDPNLGPERVAEELAAEQQRIRDMLTTKLPEGVPPPSGVSFSGGGYQGFWRLSDGIEIDGEEAKYEEAKLYNLALELKFGADNCHNVDRIMRLPGTINWPDERKIKKGRTPTLAKIVELKPERVYSIAEFTPAPHAGAREEQGVRRADSITEIDELDRWQVSKRLKAVVLIGHDPSHPLGGSDQSRSAWLWFAINGLLRAEVPPGVVLALITDEKYRISESVLDKGGHAEEYARRQITKASAEVADPTLADMNSKHAVVNDYGGKTLVMTVGEAMQFQPFPNFRHRYQNRRVQISEKERPRLGDWWLDHPQRRQYDRVLFLPGMEAPVGMFNLWRGWSVTGRPGACENFLSLVRDVICDGREDLYQWLLNWMAHAIQYPAHPAEVAIVLRGGQGVGKSFFVKRFGELFGRHFVAITDPKHVVGNFNKILQDALLVFSDEAFAGEDKRSAAILKGLITEEHITIEPKGVDAFKAKKYFRLILASNERRVVMADVDDRRYLVLDVSETHKRDHHYFHGVHEEWVSGGREAFMDFLQSRDITAFDQRERPVTAALVDQQTLSFRGAQQVVYLMLNNGEAPVLDRRNDEVFVATQEVQRDAPFRVSPRAIATELGRCTGGRRTERHKGRRGFWLPSLGKARQLWASAVGINISWPEDDGTWAEIPRGRPYPPSQESSPF